MMEQKLEPGFRKEGDVYYYTDVRSDIKPSENTAATNKEKWGHWRRENFEFFKRELEELPKGLLLLDIGAGQSHFRELFEPFEAVGVDFYPYPRVAVVCDLNAKLPFKDGSADILVLSNVLEHIAEPLMMLKECRRVLKDGGVLLGAVPFLIEVHQRPYDFYRYTDIALTRLFGEAGFARASVLPVVSNYALFKNTSERFFGDLIRQLRRGSIPEKLLGFLVRAYWFFFRLEFFRIGKPLFARSGGSPDAALGYCFKAVR